MLLRSLRVCVEKGMGGSCAQHGPPILGDS